MMRRNRPARDEPATTEPDPAPVEQNVSHETDVASAPAVDALVQELVDHEALSTSELDDIPVLTDIAQDDEQAGEPQADAVAPEFSIDDFPVLTDAVEMAPPAVIDAEQAADEQHATASEEDEALIGGLPAEAFGVVAGSIAAHATATPEEQSRLSPDDPRWATLAEEIRMQVLQRVDLFTERGLHERLKSHLQPIVDRASAELVTTIDAQLGHVLRAYVAEAIEREIEKWRHDTR